MVGAYSLPPRQTHKEVWAQAMFAHEGWHFSGFPSWGLGAVRVCVSGGFSRAGSRRSAQSLGAAGEKATPRYAQTKIWLDSRGSKGPPHYEKVKVNADYSLPVPPHLRQRMAS